MTCTDQLGGTQIRTRKCDNPKPEFGGLSCSQLSNGGHETDEMGCNGTIESQTIDPGADCYMDFPDKLFHHNDDKITLNEAKLNIPLIDNIDYHQDDIIIRDNLEDKKTTTTINDTKGNERGDTIIDGKIDIYR